MTDIQYEHRLTALETQTKRFISDMESEKDTRARVNAEVSKNFELVNQRLTFIERTLWVGFGILIAVETTLRLFKVL